MWNLPENDLSRLRFCRQCFSPCVLLKPDVSQIYPQQSMEGRTDKLFMNSWTNGPCFLPSPMFPKSITLPKFYIISPCFPTVLSIISRSRSLHQGLASLFSHISAAPSFYIIFRFPHVCLFACLFFSPPPTPTAGQEAVHGVAGSEQQKCWLIASHSWLSSQAVPNGSAFSWVCFEPSSLFCPQH